MKSNIALPILVTSAAALCLTLALAGSPQETTRPALKQDLVSASGERVVEIIEASYRLSENVLAGGSCRIRNLSGQNITGLGFLWTVTLANGEVSQMQKLVDYSLHKDIVDNSGGGPFAPYGEKVVPFIERESDTDGHAIASVKVEVTFAVFEDARGVGIEDSKMYQRLILRREGAEIYRRWLGDIYGDDPKNVGRVVEKLSSGELPADERLRDEGVEIGAASYRQWLRGVYQGRGGEDSLRRLLKRR